MANIEQVSGLFCTTQEPIEDTMNQVSLPEVQQQMLQAESLVEYAKAIRDFAEKNAGLSANMETEDRFALREKEREWGLA